MVNFLDKMLTRIFVFVFTCCSFVCSAQLSQSIDSLFQSYYKNGLFEGVALIADSSGIVYHRSFGLANHQQKISNDTATIFRIGSLEKQFTAMLILQLVESGRLNLTGTISDYLPEYRKDTGTAVTLEQLLTHTSGIPNYTAVPGVWEDSMKLVYTSAYILTNFCSGALEFTPGSKYKYSNTGYFILFKIIERVTRKPLAAVLRDNILEPAGMRHTGLDNNTMSLKHKAMGYYRLGTTYVNEPAIYVPNVMGAASMFSTAYDLYLWDRILYSDQLLSNKYMKLYLTPHFNIDPGFAYGFGWEFTQTGLTSGDTIFTMEHSGAIRAFRSVIFRIPAQKKCVIMLSNCGNQSAYDLFTNVMELFNGHAWKKPGSLLADRLYDAMQTKSVAGAIQAYRDKKKSSPTLEDYNSSSLEFLGERLMVFKKYKEAAAVFQLAVEEHPDYVYGYYYLGRAYEAAGRHDAAWSAYQKAVTKNTNGRPGMEAAFRIRYMKRNK